MLSAVAVKTISMISQINARKITNASLRITESDEIEIYYR